MSDYVISLKKLHPAQQQILAEAKKYNVLKCGRRFGKTELTKELTINPCLDGKPVGYWCPTYKDLHDVWSELKFTLHPVIKSKDEQVKQITLITGGKIDMWSLEDPNNGRGRKYARVIIDEAEKGRHFEDAWNQAIRPTLLDYSGDAWFMSTPKFGQTYFKEIFTYKEKFDDWMSWRFTTYDNPYMPKDEIDKYRLQYDDKTFACEFMAEDVDITNNPFAYAFNPERHVKPCQYDSGHELMISFDFNVDPITCVAAQHYDSKIRFVREFRLANSDIYELCARIKAAFPWALLLITGDASGHGRQAISRGNINYYQVIQQELNLSDGQMKQPHVNPAIADTRVLMNSILQNYNVEFDPEGCPFTIQDLKYTEVDSDGKIKKEENERLGRGHLLDGTRYLFQTFFDYFINII